MSRYVPAAHASLADQADTALSVTDCANGGVGKLTCVQSAPPQWKISPVPTAHTSEREVPDTPSKLPGSGVGAVVMYHLRSHSGTGVVGVGLGVRVPRVAVLVGVADTWNVAVGLNVC